ncbi:2OG-Fe(II) oxygenase [Novosphingobium sp. FSW06-99]|uniref:2OG-Fe(II) oxygenase n=1 Tax=Novosphingobium sp. FSW06-99 TaxID=1739113 RepID=UPI00076DD97A|nr:2OG-Fe(II) oxygenase [Novosphingobium sp. FSW06-99]KUR80678.1 hypothetical protein AQZ49_01170 [Novosphingobium sp. FSW06-99]
MLETRITAAPLPQRKEIADGIVARLTETLDEARGQWRAGHAVRSAVIDELLPEPLALAIGSAFPSLDAMTAKGSIRERKYVGAQMNRYSPLLEEAVFAFQDARVIALVAEITGLRAIEPDADLYAGGISAMAPGNFLRPHLDNSHDARRQRYRVLNLLYYVTPGWQEADGGSLQLWDNGPKGAPRTIASKFNRLALMATDRCSWHSVNEVVGQGVRQCVSNYYFSEQSPDRQPYFHATSFRAEHCAGLADVVMRIDNSVRTAVLKLTGNRLYTNPHRYDRSA